MRTTLTCSISFQVYRMGNLSFGDTGWYSCRVRNEHMDDESCGYLEVVAEEPKASEVLIGLNKDTRDKNRV